MGKENTEYYDLYIELVKLQKEIIAKGHKVIVLFEGRDAAGKDGMIKTITRYLSPRETRIVALSKPTEHESRSWYFQRYASQLPAKGELVFFNRSWYNRAGVEKVMGYCTANEYRSFFREVELFEQMLTEAGFILIKYYLDISKKEQKKRLKDRLENPLKQWKISPIDLEASKYWDEYSDARNEMLKRTNFDYAPWYVVDADDKPEAREAVMSHLIDLMPFNDRRNETENESDAKFLRYKEGDSILHD